MNILEKEKILEIVKRLDNYRESEGHSKAAFARLFDLSPNSYSVYLSGRLPSSEVLYEISKKTGVNVQWLFTGVGPTKACDIKPIDSEIRVLQEELTALKASGTSEELEKWRSECVRLEEEVRQLKNAREVSTPSNAMADASFQHTLMLTLQENFKLKQRVAELEAALGAAKR